MPTRSRRLLHAALLMIAVPLLLGAPAAAFAAAPAAPAAPVTAIGGVDDFSFTSFDGQYTLSRAASGESQLHTVETLVAQFPDYDQNRGIIRALVTAYDGHTTRITINSVTDGAGAKRDFTVSTDGDFTKVTIAVPDGQYVHGSQTYVIDYSQQNVTKYFANTGDDEFYWDTNGVGWAQPFGSVAAHVTVDPSLVPALNGATACYSGPEGSTTKCEITGSGGSYSATVSSLGPYENMTVVVGFAAKTFAPPVFSLFDYLSLPALIGAVLGLVGAVGALVLRFTTLRDAPSDIVVAQYEPPSEINPLIAANIVGQTKKGMAAALLDLAVRRKLRIIERPSGGLFGGNEFGVQQLDASGLDTDETMVMQALFNDFSASRFGALLRNTVTPGAFGQQAFASAAPGPADSPVKWLVKRDTSLGAQVQSLTKLVAAEVVTRGWRRKPAAIGTGILTLLVLAGLAVLFFFGGGTPFSVVAIVGLVWVGFGAVGAAGSRRPLTVEGAKLKDHLEGLRLYIQLAEADRLKMLQSITGAERIDTTDGAQIVKVYEKLLPYAVLFGLEKEWGAELAKYYSTTAPDWYDGSNVGAFQAGYFAASLGSLSSSVSTSYSGSASSSSSGGSGGGGSSGGGGGGGGGGGI